MRHQQSSQTNGFSFWKRPVHKWFVLLAGLLNLLSLWLSIREYRRIAAAGILSPSQWSEYTAQKHWQFALSGMLVLYFFGEFLLGYFVRCQRSAQLANGVLLLLLASLWGAAGFGMHLAVPGWREGLWLSLLILALICALSNFRNCCSRKEPGAKPL